MEQRSVFCSTDMTSVSTELCINKPFQDRMARRSRFHCPMSILWSSIARPISFPAAARFSLRSGQIARSAPRLLLFNEEQKAQPFFFHLKPTSWFGPNHKLNHRRAASENGSAGNGAMPRAQPKIASRSTTGLAGAERRRRESPRELTSREASQSTEL